MSKSTNFRDLKTSFEARSTPTTASSRAFHRSMAGDIANMSSDNKFDNKTTRRVPAVAASIDSVLDTSPTQPTAVRPQAKLRPSWIGPHRAERPVTPGVQAMKQHVTVSYTSHGLQPPVYIFTDLSDPPWDAIEMHREQGEHGEYTFSEDFHVEDGEYQYKFRLGPGDWWACDDSQPTVDDGKGNKNNLVVVKPQSHYFDQSSVPKDSKAASPTSTPTTSKPAAIAIPKIALPGHTDATPTPAATATAVPLLKHETFLHDESSQTQHTPEREQADPFNNDDEEPESSHALMKHEIFQPSKGKDDDSTSDEDDDSSSSSSSDDDDDDDDAEEPHASPLLRHESLSPSSVEQEHSPLFRHESIGMGYNHHEPPASKSTPPKPSRQPSSPSIPAEAGPHDQHLETFPTDHAGIMDRIRRCSTSLAADETEDDDDDDSQAVSESSMPVRSLPSVDEADEEELEKIREAEEEEFEKEEADGEELDPLKEGAPITPPHTPKEPEDADFQPKVSQHGEKEIQQTIAIEIIEERRGFFDTLTRKLDGRGTAVAVIIGVVAVAAGVCTIRFL